MSRTWRMRTGFISKAMLAAPSRTLLQGFALHREHSSRSSDLADVVLGDVEHAFEQALVEQEHIEALLAKRQVLQRVSCQRSGGVEQECTIGIDAERGRCRLLPCSPQDSNHAIGINGWIDLFYAEVGSGTGRGESRARTIPDLPWTTRCVGKDDECGAVHDNEGHHDELVRGASQRKRKVVRLRPGIPLAIIHARSIIAMVTVGDDQLLVAHLVADEFDEVGIGHPAEMMQNSIFVADLATVFHICGRGCEGSIDLAGGVAVEHEELAEMGAGGAQEFQAVGLGLSEGLLVAMDDSS